MVPHSTKPVPSVVMKDGTPTVTVRNPFTHPTTNPTDRSISPQISRNTSPSAMMMIAGNVLLNVTVSVVVETKAEFASQKPTKDATAMTNTAASRCRASRPSKLNSDGPFPARALGPGGLPVTPGLCWVVSLTCRVPSLPACLICGVDTPHLGTSVNPLSGADTPQQAGPVRAAYCVAVRCW